MTAHSQRKLLTLAIVLVSGIIVGYVLRDLVPVINQMIPYSCTYQGKIYAHGSSVPSGDSCNTCGCNNGEVSCTAMACEPFEGVPLPPRTPDTGDTNINSY